MKTAQLGDYLFWGDQLVKVIGITPAGAKTVIMETLDDQLCPHCNKSIGKEQIHVIETSPLFQDNAQPISTISK